MAFAVVLLGAAGLLEPAVCGGFCRRADEEVGDEKEKGGGEIETC